MCISLQRLSGVGTYTYTYIQYSIQVFNFLARVAEAHTLELRTYLKMYAAELLQASPNRLKPRMQQMFRCMDLLSQKKPQKHPR